MARGSALLRRSHSQMRVSVVTRLCSMLVLCPRSNNRYFWDPGCARRRFAARALALFHRELRSRPNEVNSLGPHPQVLGPQPQNDCYFWDATLAQGARRLSAPR
jgi:hypothetical protein